MNIVKKSKSDKIERIENYLFCFDWDGTIVNSFDIMYDSMIKLYKKYEKFSWFKRELSYREKMRLKHEPLEVFLRGIFPRIGLNILLKDLRKFYKREIKKLELVDNSVRDLLEALKASNNILMVVSNKPSYIIREEMKILNLYDYFNINGVEMIITPEETGGIEKPDIRLLSCITEMIEKIAPRPADLLYQSYQSYQSYRSYRSYRIIYFGDSKIDAEFAKTINARFFCNSKDYETIRIYNENCEEFHCFREVLRKFFIDYTRNYTRNKLKLVA